MRQLRRTAPAKINISLEVLGRRPDGYHDLVSVMQTVTLFDILDFEPAYSVSVTSSDPRLSGADNLVARAAELLRQSYHAPGCHIVLDKHIPVSAGLGGGSSDAASTLGALCDLWNLHLGPRNLWSLAERLGSDVPFFLMGGAALVEGRGERVRKLPDSKPNRYLLVKPPIAVSTAEVFRALPESAWTDGQRTREIATTLEAGGIVSFGINGLQETLFRLHPEAQTCFDEVRQLKPDSAIISGTGPTVVARFQNQESMEGAAKQLKGNDYWIAVASDSPRTKP